jgi:hypothetical protein
VAGVQTLALPIWVVAAAWLGEEIDESGAVAGGEGTAEETDIGDVEEMEESVSSYSGMPERGGY